VRLGRGQAAWAWDRLAAALDEMALPTGVRPVEPIIAPTRDLLADGLRLRSPAWPWAMRCGLATSGAAVIAIAAGVERPYWAPVAAATVLEVRTARVAGQHTLQNALGTSLGALAAVALLAVPLPAWSLIVIATVMQAAVQLAGPANSGLGALLVTPLALLLAELARPGLPAEPLVATRVVDTLLGLVVGFAASLVLWPHAAAHRLPYALADCVSAMGVLLAKLLSEARGPQPLPAVRPGPDSRPPRQPGAGQRRRPLERRRGAARHHVEATLEWLSEMHVEAENEPGEAAQSSWPAVVAARRLGYLILLEPPGLRDALPATAASPEDVRVLFGRLATGLRGDSHLPPPEPPELPPFPPLRSEFAALVGATAHP
jgi:uncharacterized membrane protein YccC